MKMIMKVITVKTKNVPIIVQVKGLVISKQESANVKKVSEEMIVKIKHALMIVLEMEIVMMILAFVNVTLVILVLIVQRNKTQVALTIVLAMVFVLKGNANVKRDIMVMIVLVVVIEDAKVVGDQQDINVYHVMIGITYYFIGV